jgi:hypothetical protein
MANESDVPSEPTLAVPGVLCVSPLASDRSVVHVGPAAGWMLPRGIARWEREISFLGRNAMTPELARALHAVLPHEQVAPKKLPMTFKAVGTSPFLPVRSKLLLHAKQHGARVHTVGVDRVTAGFYYFAEGGAGEPVKVQGNLVEMLAPSLKPTSSNAEVETLREALIDRLLAKFSGGTVSELAVELADALPRMSSDGRGLVGTHLEVFEVQARALARRSARLEIRAREVVRALAAAERAGKDRATVPLYGEAEREELAPLQVRIGDETIELPAVRRWIVTGALHEEPRAPIRSTAPVPVRVRAPRPSEAPPSMDLKKPAAEEEAQTREQASEEEEEEEARDSSESIPPPPPELEELDATNWNFLLRAFALIVVAAAVANLVWHSTR